MFSKTQDDIELEELLKKEGDSLKKTFQENYIKQELTLNIFRKSIEHCDYNNFSENRLIWNFGSYINIISFDLKVIAENLVFSNSEWGKRYFIRQSALLIYEAINDIFELLGKDFRKVITEFPNPENIISDLKIVIKNLNNYKDKYFEKLKEIRHNCSGHREKDSIEQLKIITSLDWSYGIEFTTKFDGLLNELGKFSQQVINICVENSKEFKQ